MLEICKRLLNEYGEIWELGKVQEELTELDHEIDRYIYHGENNREKIIEEIIDVNIQLTTLKVVFNITDKEIDDGIYEKVKEIAKEYLN